MSCRLDISREKCALLRLLLYYSVLEIRYASSLNNFVHVANDRCFPKEKKNRSTKTQDSWLASILPISPAVVCIVGVYDNSVGAIVGRGWWLYGGAVKSD